MNSLAAVKAAAINIFICFYLLGLLLSVLPPSIWQATLYPWIAPFWYCLGLGQQWAFFAAPMQNVNYKIFAVITFSDGVTRLCDIPEIANSIVDMERSWKLLQLAQDIAPRQSLIWPDIAKFIARQHDEDKRHPILVSLECEQRVIKAPAWLAEPAPQKDGCFVFYIHQILPEDLR